MSNSCGPLAGAVSAGVDDLNEKDVALELISVPAIQARMLVVGDRQVMLDEDLAELYGVETGALTSVSCARCTDRSTVGKLTT